MKTLTIYVTYNIMLPMDERMEMLFQNQEDAIRYAKACMPDEEFHVRHSERSAYVVSDSDYKYHWAIHGRTVF